MFTKNSKILERYQHKLYFINLREMYEFSTSTSFKTNSPKQVPPNAVVKTTEVQEIHMAAFLQQKYCSCSPIKLNIDLWTHSFCYCPTFKFSIYVVISGWDVRQHWIWDARSLNMPFAISNNRLSAFVRRFSNKEQS